MHSVYCYEISYIFLFGFNLRVLFILDESAVTISELSNFSLVCQDKLSAELKV